jgi:hypothetical protein
MSRSSGSNTGSWRDKAECRPKAGDQAAERSVRIGQGIEARASESTEGNATSAFAATLSGSARMLAASVGSTFRPIPKQSVSAGHEQDTPYISARLLRRSSSAFGRSIFHPEMDELKEKEHE